MMPMFYDAVVVGGGLAGLTAAAYLARAGKSVLLLEKQKNVGGLVQTFQRNEVYFDGGLRSIENSGIVFPMLKQLGIEIEFSKSPVTIGIGNTVLKLENRESLEDYKTFLQAQFPENKDDVEAITKEIRKIMGYMDVLYGIDNPTFLNVNENLDYVLKKIAPWIFKFLLTVRKIDNLDEPVETYLKRFTKNQALIDLIAQHFFQKTPASFALSYFSLYLDYHYPKGGTAVLPQKLATYILENGGEIQMNVLVESFNPEEKIVTDSMGNTFQYKNLVWAGDLKRLYDSIPVEKLKNRKLAKKILEKRSLLKELKGGDSVFTVYATINEQKTWFSDICTGHFFYTPDKAGLSAIPKEDLELFLNEKVIDTNNLVLKNKLKKYLEVFCKLNTFEVAIPVLRDPDLAPDGKVGLVISLLFDFQLAKKIEAFGWTKEMKEFLEQTILKTMDESIFPGITNKVVTCFSSSPLTIQNLTLNTDGGITGWAFTNPYMPAVNKTLQVAKSVLTPIPSVFAAGQWVFSPSGMPIAILTGKLASDKVLKMKNK